MERGCPERSLGTVPGPQGYYRILLCISSAQQEALAQGHHHSCVELAIWFLGGSVECLSLDRPEKKGLYLMDPPVSGSCVSFPFRACYGDRCWLSG